jgi:hypothetical protein
MKEKRNEKKGLGREGKRSYLFDVTTIFLFLYFWFNHILLVKILNCLLFNQEKWGEGKDDCWEKIFPNLSSYKVYIISNNS